MKPGTKPKPTAHKRLEGNPGKRSLNVLEPELPAPPSATQADPFDEPPAELARDTRARAEWRRLAPMLRRARVVTEGDRASLIALCQQWSRYLEANATVSTEGMVMKSPNGYPITNPYIPIANKALSHCTKLWAELGLTPSSRSRVGVTERSPADPFAEFDEPLPDMQAH